MLNSCCKLDSAWTVWDKVKQNSVLPHLHLGDHAHLLPIKRKKSLVKIVWDDVIENYHNASGKKNHWGYLGDLKSDFFTNFFFFNTWFINFNLLLAGKRMICTCRDLALTWIMWESGRGGCGFMGLFLAPFPVQVSHRSQQCQGFSMPSSRWKVEAKRSPKASGSEPSPKSSLKWMEGLAEMSTGCPDNLYPSSPW